MGLVRSLRFVSRPRPLLVALALACAAALPACSRSRPVADSSPAKVADTPEPDDPPDLYGPAPCTPSKLDGPAPCASDDECVKRSGAGWYCTPEPLTLDDGCGGKLAWGRVCACCEDDAGP